MNMIQKLSLFAQAVASKRSSLAGGGDETCVLVKKVTFTWSQLVDKMLSLMGGNRKCIDVATGEIAKHLKEDGDRLLTNVVNHRKEVNTFMNRLESFKDDFSGKVPSSLDALLTDRVPNSFQSEFTSEAFDDIASHKAAIHLNALQTKKMEFEGSLQVFYQERKMDAEKNNFEVFADSWKTELIALGDQCTFSQIFEKSKVIMASVPAKNLKPFAAAISQERF